jgi:tetratricopeptide (TPR) repeat protein
MTCCPAVARVLALALVASLAGACAHGGRQNRFVAGTVPDYTQAWKDLTRPPAESHRHFVARVKRMAAQARPSRPPALSLEGSDPVLRDALATLALGPTPANHFRVAEAYRRAGVLDRAHDHLLAAVQIDRRFAAGWDGLARVWRDWGAPAAALGEASRAVYFAPGEPAYHNTLGTVLQALGRWSEARGEYEAARAGAPRAAWAPSNLCALELAAGRPADARQRCLEALAIDPAFGPARANLARAERALAPHEPDPAPSN